MARSLNKVLLIGRLGADPEMRYTGSGMPVTTFSLATNRQWTDKEGNAQEETDWHNVVAWDRLAQICNEHLAKGRLVYIEGRLRTRSYEANGQKQYRTEIVASDMLMLDSVNGAEGTRGAEPVGKSAPAMVAAASGSRGRGRAAEPREMDDEDELPF
ncbi:MAG: single-stranded DNA-binding protein [Chloroflexota bacterium]|nr:single-stranded DNA-binding protein [Chloroflexota bacterium]MDQ5864220.1 single-stranded DNA-binding protein [Chloroflexota bacterium]